jgi:hypothetical protein
MKHMDSTVKIYYPYAYCCMYCISCNIVHELIITGQMARPTLSDITNVLNRRSDSIQDINEQNFPIHILTTRSYIYSIHPRRWSKNFACSRQSVYTIKL